MQPAFEHLGYKEGDFPVSENISSKVISLPMYPELPKDHQDYVAEQIMSFFKG
jgi:dTDP-4-amino-4,6-dideoxygalactose transaminase